MTLGFFHKISPRAVSLLWFLEPIRAKGIFKGSIVQNMIIASRDLAFAGLLVLELLRGACDFESVVRTCLG